MTKPTADYLNFIGSLNESKALLTDLRALKKEANKKKRRLNTLVSKYAFIEDIVAVGMTGTPLNLAVKTALKKIGFKQVFYVDKGGREDVRTEHNDSLLIIEVTGVSGTIEGRKIRQHMANLLVSRRKNTGKKVYGCLVINHHNETPYEGRSNRSFIQKQMREELEAAEMSVITTLTLRLMLIAVIKGELALDEFYQRLCNIGEVDIPV